MSFSQNNEEEIILKYFGYFVGTFLDIGANDGITFSNTHALALAGWNGILIEPSPKAYERLATNYKDVNGIKTFNFAIGTKDGPDILLESMSLVTPKDIALVSTLVVEETQRFKSVTKYMPVEVDVFTWETFVNQHGIKDFDFVSIDAEGMDLDILRQIDLSRTAMVCVEWNGNDKHKFVEVCKDFRLIAENAENLIFAR